MKRIYISGPESVNDELVKLFGGNVSVVKNPNDADIVIESTNFSDENKHKLIEEIDGKTDKSVPILTSSLCVSVSEQSTFCKSPERLIGIGLYNSISNTKRFEVAPSRISNDSILEKVKGFLNSVNIGFSIVPDRVGLVFPRILSMIINEATQVYDEKIASMEDIDLAMRLGTNYPFGPLKWADRIGIELIYNILLSLQRDFGDDRYRPHPRLKEMVNLKQKFY